MEYRVRYRNIPWPVAICVLPGKIIGTFFIKPWLRFKRDWNRILMRRLHNLVVLMIVLLVFTLACVLADKLTEGGVDRLFSEAWALWSQTTPAAPETVPPPDVTPTAEEIHQLIRRNHR